MLIELDKIDKIVIDDNNLCIIMVIIDTIEPWVVDAPKGLFDFKQKKIVEDKKLEHLVYLNKKVGNYINCIGANAVSNFFPDREDLAKYNYIIEVITNFDPDKEYLEAINKMNQFYSKQTDRIKIVQETRKINS
ncbi:hypothetical protein SAMN02745111_00936 [Eubacterium uniforme]|uniref:Uncharacterized protein n=1 Tax=Eubacterium uniforme TaxID=39495 RepID=A0A1T4VH29_9FIRM|nr:hypothetical protein [Eubacterium uniforme]SKA64255.1 hypothetical protein SAMN02745111_00936 [Eubacterium uniforme]